jgi:predicted permease
MKIRSRLKALLSRKQLERDLAAELQAHLEMQEAANRAAGMAPDEARCAARRQFGGVDQIKEQAREQRSWVWLEHLMKDAQVSLRMLAKNRGATMLAIGSIALGIGVTTSLFSIADALVFRPGAFFRPEEIYSVLSRGDDQRFIGYGWRDCEDMARATAGAAEVVAYQRSVLALAGEESSEVVTAYLTTPNFFSMLGVRAALGQANLAPRSDGRPQAVLGHGLWMRRFGGDPAIVGKTIVLNSKAFAVAGVTPPAFTGLVRGVPCDVWIDADALGRRAERDSRSGQFQIIVRLRPAAAPEAIAARCDAAIRGPDGYKPAPAGTPGTWLNAFALTWRQKLAAGGGLLPVFGLLLLVACANAAQLRLAQAEARRKEMGMRLALGSSPWGLARLLLIETTIVSAAGAAAGLFLAAKVIDLITLTISAVVGFVDLGLRIDWRVGAFTLVATVLASALAGVAPARHALRLDVLDILRSEDGTARAKNRMQRVLVAGQTAASVVFFGLALLFTMSFRHALAVWPGFDPGKSMVAIPAASGGPMARTTWGDQAAERLQAMPGVRAVTYARRLPLSLSGGGLRLRVEVPGQAPLAVDANMVGPNYFPVMGTRVLAGRGIDPGDRADASPVVVVSKTLARQAFGERNPIGESITIEGRLWQVVGLVEDAPSNDLHETILPLAYFSFAQMPRGDLTLLVETAVEPGSMVRPLLQELKRFDPDVVTIDVKTLRQYVDRALFLDRVAALGSVGLGVLGFLLTAAGLFGMVQYSVNRRTREFGVRIALGAGPGAIQRSVLTESLRIVAPGVVLGLALLAGGAWTVQSFLLGVSPLNPLAYATCAGAAVAFALLAAWLPARRATRLDLVEVLRAE